MDRNAAVTVARALIEEMGIQPGELFPQVEAAEPAPDIDALLPRRRWVPDYDDDYCFLCSGQETVLAAWREENADWPRMNAGNVFPSLEDAEEHAANIRAWVEMRERSDSPEGGYLVWYDSPNRPIPGVGFSTTHLRGVAVAHIGQDRIDALAKWIWRIG